MTKRNKARQGPFQVERIEADELEGLTEILQAATPRGRIAKWRPHADRLKVASDTLDEAESLIDKRGTVENMDRFDALLAQANLEIERAQNEQLDVYGRAARSSRHGKTAATARWAEHGEINEAIKRLATRPEYRDEAPAELWPHLHAMLDDMQLQPHEVGQGIGKVYKYNGGTMSYSAFRKAVERARK